MYPYIIHIHVLTYKLLERGDVKFITPGPRATRSGTQFYNIAISAHTHIIYYYYMN